MCVCVCVCVCVGVCAATAYAATACAATPGSAFWWFTRSILRSSCVSLREPTTRVSLVGSALRSGRFPHQAAGVEGAPGVSRRRPDCVCVCVCHSIGSRSAHTRPHTHTHTHTLSLSLPSSSLSLLLSRDNQIAIQYETHFV